MEENAPKISVIVPMYNVEEFLNLCITSILEQTFKDFELILIDDCSTDKTLEVAESFSDSRIKILRNEKKLENPGLVRNIGLDAAQGDYIFFCDADDAICLKGLEIFYEVAAENDADIVLTTKWFRSKNPAIKNLQKAAADAENIPAAVKVAEDLKTRLNQEFLVKRIHIAPWVFLYRRKFLIENDIKFPAEISVAEDVAFNFDAVFATDKIFKISTPLYFYRVRSDSISHSKDKIRRNIHCILNLYDHISEKLSPLNDFEFEQKIKIYWASHVMGSYLIPFVTSKGSGVFQEIFTALESKFGKESSFLTALLQMYSQMRLINAKNKNLKANLELAQAENKKLKSALENIQKQISEVVKDNDV